MNDPPGTKPPRSGSKNSGGAISAPKEPPRPALAHRARAMPEEIPRLPAPRNRRRPGGRGEPARTAAGAAHSSARQNRAGEGPRGSQTPFVGAVFIGPTYLVETLRDLCPHAQLVTAAPLNYRR
jgi:hypothetical protein